ncbi:hypothetical protein HOY80DRAFT_71777 [Tuber brumale]|nr:hypothetical protein HOY80DRAFT_71777 [Tuber brumale]
MAAEREERLARYAGHCCAGGLCLGLFVCMREGGGVRYNSIFFYIPVLAFLGEVYIKGSLPLLLFFFPQLLLLFLLTQQYTQHPLMHLHVL